MGLELPKRKRRVALGVIAVAAALSMSGCSAIYSKSQLRRLAMPLPASKEAPHTADLWQWAWLAAMLVGVVVWGLIAYVSIRYHRRSEDHVPVQTRYNLPIEIFYTIAPIMMVIVFFFFTVKTQDQVLHNFDHPDQNVTVVGQQWSWTFNYEKAGPDGQTVYDVGTPANDPTLWLVKDAKTEFHLYSPDVIHSFWVPVFLFKMDVVPGRDNHFGLQPDKYGTFAGRCAELCGVYHSRMLFNVKVVDQTAFDQHMKALVAAGNVGQNLGNANVTIQPGLESASGGDK